jgi:hypothetical protein
MMFDAPLPEPGLAIIRVSSWNGVTPFTIDGVPLHLGRHYRPRSSDLTVNAVHSTWELPESGTNTDYLVK